VKQHKTIPLDQLHMNAAEFDGIMRAAFEVKPKKEQRKRMRRKGGSRKAR
jgi:hypothetical protein